MKEFAKDIGIALIAAVILFLLCQQLPYRQRNRVVSKRDYIVEHADQINTLVMGSSIAEQGINPTEIGDSCFNLGIMAQVQRLDAAILKKYLPQLPKVKHVVYLMHYNVNSINEHSFTKDQDYFITWHVFGIDSTANFKQWLTHIDINYRYTVPVERHFVMPAMGYEPTHEYYEKNQRRMNPPINDEDIDEAVASMSYLASVCSANGVELIVIVPPFTQDWLALTNNQGRTTVDSVLHTLERDYHARCKNYMFDADFADDSLFANWNHLNYAGATLLSQKVKLDFSL